MRLSVVVPLPDARSPTALLEALAAQTVAAADMDVVVVDTYARTDASVRDAVTRVAPRLPVRLFEQPGRSRAAGANRGVREAATPLVLLLSSDFVPTPGMVEAHLSLHEARREASVCGLGPGIFAPGFTVTPFMRWLEDSGQLFGTSFTHTDPVALRGFWYGANVSLRRELLHRAGGFDEAFVHEAVDDYELGRRLFAAGMEVVYLPGAVAHHDHFITMEERAAAMRRTGESLRIYDSAHPGAYWWQRAARRPDLVYLGVEWLAWLRATLTARDAHRGRYFAWAMERHLARGYRAALASAGRPPAPRA